MIYKYLYANLEHSQYIYTQYDYPFAHMKTNSVQYIYALCGGSVFESVYSHMFSSPVCIYFIIRSLANKWLVIIFNHHFLHPFVHRIKDYCWSCYVIVLSERAHPLAFDWMERETP